MPEKEHKYKKNTNSLLLRFSDFFTTNNLPHICFSGNDFIVFFFLRHPLIIYPLYEAVAFVGVAVLG